MAASLRVRRDITDIYIDYVQGNKKPLEDLIKAWVFICSGSAPPEGPDPKHSFFTLAGYHGMPFRGAGWGNAAWWGGYCNHGNVLFPTWHRAYLYALENALRMAPGCEEVTLPFWNEPSDRTKADGVPLIFTQPRFNHPELGDIANPLFSYKFTAAIKDNLANFPDYDYSKPLNYETKRYPQSGLMGDSNIKETLAHNEKYSNVQENTKLLTQNVQGWLWGKTWQTLPGGKMGWHENRTAYKYRNCLNAPNYTVFSNTTSAAEWNNTHPGLDGKPGIFTPLESPHNDIHLSVGGYDLEPSGSNPGQSFDEIPGANGDMGENDTASFDPIFFFHHCWVDNVFWQWQTIHESENALEIIPEYPGTNSVDNQGPTPGIPGGTWLTLDSPLAPFTKADGKPYTSSDVVNIQGQLGYTYENKTALRDMVGATSRAEVSIKISGFTKQDIAGSFVMGVWGQAKGDAEPSLIAAESVLSRWHVAGCKNCQTYANIQRHIPLHGISVDQLESGEVAIHSVRVHTRDDRSGKGAALTGAKKIEPTWDVFHHGKRVAMR